MSDGLRTAIYWLSSGLGAFGVVLILLALVQGALRGRVQETTPLRTAAVAITFLAGAAILGATAFLWPHPPE